MVMCCLQIVSLYKFFESTGECPFPEPGVPGLPEFLPRKLVLLGEGVAVDMIRKFCFFTLIRTKYMK